MKKYYRLEIVMDKETKEISKKEFVKGFDPIELMGILEMIKLEKLKKIKTRKPLKEKEDI